MFRTVLLIVTLFLGYDAFPGEKNHHSNFCENTIDRLIESRFDVVVYGSTPAGIASAVTAARNGKSAVIIDPHLLPGGMPASGMSNIDFRTYESLGGFCKELMDSVTLHYKTTFGPESKQLHDCWYGLNYEPHVALQIFQNMIEETGISMFNGWLLTNMDKKNSAITSVEIQNLKTNRIEQVKGELFIDATYEGDLMAMAGEDYVLGAESRNTYNESFAPEKANNHVMAYNFRVIVTNDPENRISFHQPKNYNEDNFKYLINGFKTGEVDKLQDVLQILNIPNSKANMNDRHNANMEGFMLYELSDKWPEASHAEREKISETGRLKAQSYFYLLSHNRTIPEHVREEMQQWGYAKDEFTETDHFPPWIYVREGRRMIGQYIFTQHDGSREKGSVRAPAHKTAVAVGDFFFSSHGTHLDENGNKMGHIGEPVLPYQIPYGVILPQKTNNLLVPVAVSASRVGFASIRMEPTWMALGEAAGAAAVESMNQKKAPENIDVQKLQTRLHNAGAITFYTSDIKPGTKYFNAVQFLGNRGFFQHLYPDSLQVEPGEHITKYVVGAFTLHDISPEKILSERLKTEWLKMAENKLELKKDIINQIEKNNKTRGDFILSVYQAAMAKN